MSDEVKNNMPIKKKERDVSIDVVRCFAVFSVMSIHFFLNTGYYSQTMTGLPMFFMTCMRTLFTVCVPLFMLMTGYLMGERSLFPLKKNYYFGLARKVIFPYMILTVFIWLFQIFGMNEEMSLKDAMFNLLGYKQYSWYVNMYIGLYLLIPFLNLIWKNVPSQKEERILIVTLVCLTILPSMLNTFDFQTEGWWRSPASTKTYQQLIPYWWTGIYPITYYFTGAYMAKHGTAQKRSAWQWLLLVLCGGIIFGAYSFYRGYGAQFVWGAWCDWNGLGSFLLTICIFCFWKTLPLQKLPKVCKKALQRIASLSFGMYIASWIMDQCVYPVLKQRIPAMPDRMWAYLPTVGIVFLGSLLISAVAHGLLWVISFYCGQIRKVFGRFRRQK